MKQLIKRIILGKPLENEALNHEQLSVVWGLPILASDAISSVAYATEEILLVLVPAIGILAFGQLTLVSWAIIGLLALLTISYRQTIQSYPNGGGAYIVAMDNLGTYAGLTAGAALAIGYILTVAVSITSGTHAIISAFPNLAPYKVNICLVILLLILIGNLRGIRESSKIFGLPSYAFMAAIGTAIVVGIAKVKVFGYVPQEPVFTTNLVEPLTLFLILRAFSSGCSALTGVEAVSNTVPNFREPSVKRAQTVLLLLAGVVLVLFGGTALLANLYRVQPDPTMTRTVLSQIAEEIFGRGTLMYYFIQATTALILALAANTAYSGFPMMVSVMAKDGFAPRQLTERGERLAYSNGILLLSLFSAILIVVFKGDTHLLIPLYGVGVFASFTLSQAGMFVKWLKSRKQGWVHKAIINGIGAFTTLVAVCVIGVTKFVEGAWMVIVVIPLIVLLLLKIKRHYSAIAQQLRLSPEELADLDLSKDIYQNHVIVPIASLNRASVRALRYAKTISNNIVAFCVVTDKESEQRVRDRWSVIKTDIPLVIKYSQYRKIIEPLLEFIESYEENSYKKGDMITVILPQFSVKVWWQVFLHNQTRTLIEKDLLKHKHIVVSTMPLQLKPDNEVKLEHQI